MGIEKKIINSIKPTQNKIYKIFCPSNELQLKKIIEQSMGINEITLQTYKEAYENTTALERKKQAELIMLN